MELTAEQLKENWDKFLGFIDTYISSPRKEKLLEFYKKYEERFILMPASHKNSYHNCFIGGYVEHVNRVVEAALELDSVWKKFGVDDSTYTIEELVFSALNHDLGKFGTPEEACYIEQTDEWRRTKLNEAYTFNTKVEFMSVPDRGLNLLLEHGISFTKNEFLTIKLHDGLYDESNKPYLMSFSPETKPRTSLIYIVHQADLMAARIEFEKEWNDKLRTGSDKKPVSKKSPIQTKTLSNIKSPNLQNSISNFFN